MYSKIEKTKSKKCLKRIYNTKSDVYKYPVWNRGFSNVLQIFKVTVVYNKLHTLPIAHFSLVLVASTKYNM